jgi:hypothetical protein
VASELRQKSKKRKTNPPKANPSRRILCPFNRANPVPYSDTRRVSAILRHPRSAKPQLQRNKRHKCSIYVPRPSAILRHPCLSYDLHATTSAAPTIRDFASPTPSENRNYNETNGASVLVTSHNHLRFCVTHAFPATSTATEHPRFCVTPRPAKTATTTKQTAQALDLRPTTIRDFASPDAFPTTYNLRPSSTMAIEHENY